MEECYIKFKLDDGSESIAHYGVKGMKHGKHVKANDPSYLLSLGLISPEQAEKMMGEAGNAISDAAKNVQNAAGEMAKRLPFGKPEGVKDRFRDEEAGRMMKQLFARDQYREGTSLQKKHDDFMKQKRAEKARAEALKKYKEGWGENKSALDKVAKAGENAARMLNEKTKPAQNLISDAANKASKAKAQALHDIHMKRLENTPTKAWKVNVDTEHGTRKDYYEEMPNGRRRSWSESTIKDKNDPSKSHADLLKRPNSAREVARNGNSPEYADKLSEFMSKPSKERELTKTYQDMKEKYDNQRTQTPSTADRLRDQFKKIDQYKHEPERKLNKNTVVKVANEHPAKPGEGGKELAKIAYDNLAREHIDKTRAKLDAVREADRTISDSERNAIREKARQEKREKKRKEKEKWERFFGLTPKGKF